MVLLGGSVFTLLMTALLKPNLGARFFQGTTPPEQAMVAGERLASAGQRGVRTTERRAPSTRLGEQAALNEAGQVGGRAVPAKPAPAAGRQPAAGAPDLGSGGVGTDPRARAGLGAAGSPGYATSLEELPPVSKDPVGQYGIEVASLRMTAGGTAVDLRYKVVDPEKAARIGRDGGPTYILDGAGRMIAARIVQGIGDYYSARHLDKPGKIYSTLYANQGGALRSGDVVNVVMGGLHIANVRVD
jgi:hypothetical protein